MKKLFIVLLVALFAASYCYAENSATGMNGNTCREQPVYIICHNGTTTDITSNAVVVLDTTVTRIASGTTLGAYITTTTATGNALVVGVTDEAITAGSSGRVCVRGPHKVQMLGTGGVGGTFTAGATVCTSTTAGYAFAANASTDSGISPFGVLLASTAIGGQQNSGLALGLGPVYDGYTNGDGPNNYWVWVRPVSR